MGHGLAFDRNSSRTVLFGGGVLAPGLSLRGDTWVWDGSGWTQAQDVGPTARQGHAIAFDSTRDQVVLYGGATGTTVVGDTWTWDGAKWTERSRFGPPACVGASMIFDGSSALLYGGAASHGDAAAQVFAGSWRWDGQRWTQRQDIGPGSRWGHAMLFDGGRGCTVLFGGASAPFADPQIASHLLGDTWEAQGTPIGISIATFEARPSSAAPDQSVTLTVTLNQPASPVGNQVVLNCEENTFLPPFPAGSSAAQIGWTV